MIGLVCYSGAVAVLAVDVGQPLRAWFTFWYPNVHSMLTEVTFCITCYLTVLAIEYLPIVLKNRKLREVPSFLVFEFELHKLIYVLAGVGTFLSFFHQGSLGGLYGVLRGRPFAFREGLAVWPSTFFLFILSAAAVGPSFILLTTWLVEKISQEAAGAARSARIAGPHLRPAAVGLRARRRPWTRWSGSTAPRPSAASRRRSTTRWKPFGTWILFAEIVLFGLVPALILLTPRLRARTGWLVSAAAMACCGVALNRFVHDGADAGAAHAVLRPVPLLLRRAGRRSERSWRWWPTASWSIRSRSATSSFSRRSANSSRGAAGRRRARHGREVLTMFPWNYGFHWNAASHIFLGAFYTVLVVVATTVVSAVLRSRRDLRARTRPRQIRWHSDFHDLPARDRVCRHVLTGEFSQPRMPQRVRLPPLRDARQADRACTRRGSPTSRKKRSSACPSRSTASTTAATPGRSRRPMAP